MPGNRDLHLHLSATVQMPGLAYAIQVMVVKEFEKSNSEVGFVGQFNEV